MLLEIVRQFRIFMISWYHQNGDTALIHASRKDSTETIELLLLNGADTNLQSTVSVTFLVLLLCRYEALRFIYLVLSERRHSTNTCKQER